jgi:hypothetical protein
MPNWPLAHPTCKLPRPPRGVVITGLAALSWFALWLLFIGLPQFTTRMTLALLEMGGWL